MNVIKLIEKAEITSPSGEMLRRRNQINEMLKTVPERLIPDGTKVDGFIAKCNAAGDLIEAKKPYPNALLDGQELTLI